MTPTRITPPQQSERPHSIGRDHKAARVITNDISQSCFLSMFFTSLKSYAIMPLVNITDEKVFTTQVCRSCKPVREKERPLHRARAHDRVLLLPPPPCSSSLPYYCMRPGPRGRLLASVACALPPARRTTFCTCSEAAYGEPA